MKTLLSRTALFIALCLATLTAGAATPDTSDRAAQQLATHSAIAVSSVGDFVQPGTYRVQVAAKLGRPDFVLSDGSWLYQHRRVEQSEAVGTLVVRFTDKGRVSSLALVTPAAVAVLRANSRADAPANLFAKK